MEPVAGRRRSDRSGGRDAGDPWLEQYAIRMNRKIGRAPYGSEPLDEAATEKWTMKTALQNYHARMQRALDHIDRHLDGDLDLETVSRVAAFSKFHFHRQ